MAEEGYSEAIRYALIRIAAIKYTLAIIKKL